MASLESRPHTVGAFGPIDTQCKAETSLDPITFDVYRRMGAANGSAANMLRGWIEEKTHEEVMATMVAHGASRFSSSNYRVVVHDVRRKPRS